MKNKLTQRTEMNIVPNTLQQTKETLQTAEGL